MGRKEFHKCERLNFADGVENIGCLLDIKCFLYFSQPPLRLNGGHVRNYGPLAMSDTVVPKLRQENTSARQPLSSSIPTLDRS